MTRNVFTDGEPFSVASLNAMNNAHDNEGVLEGVELTTGTGDFEVDVGSGEILLGGDRVSVAAATVDHIGSGTEDRVDLVAIDNTGTASVTTGSEAINAGQPVAPDLPDGQVLAGTVYVRGGSAEILGGDIYGDYKTIISEIPPELRQFYPAGESSDFSDIGQRTGTVSSTERRSTVISETGPGILLNGRIDAQSFSNNRAYLTVDGVEHEIDLIESLAQTGTDTTTHANALLPATKFDSSLELELENTNSNLTRRITVNAWIKFD